MDLSRRGRAALYLTRLGLRILKQWARDKCPQQAAALAFKTALSLVPVTAIAFTILRSIGSLDAQSRLSEFIATRLFPGMDAVTDRIAAVLGEHQHRRAGRRRGCSSRSSPATRCTATSRRSSTTSGGSGERRTIIGKFLTFYAMVTLLPALASFSLYWSGKLVGAGTASRFLAPTAIEVLALVFMNKLLPRTNVNWKPRLIGRFRHGLRAGSS